MKLLTGLTGSKLLDHFGGLRGRLEGGDCSVSLSLKELSLAELEKERWIATIVCQQRLKMAFGFDSSLCREVEDDKFRVRLAIVWCETEGAMEGLRGVAKTFLIEIESRQKIQKRRAGLGGVCGELVDVGLAFGKVTAFEKLDGDVERRGSPRRGVPATREGSGCGEDVSWGGINEGDVGEEALRRNGTLINRAELAE